MKPSTPVITLLGGTTLGVVVLVASIIQTPSGAAPVNYAATSPAGGGTTVTACLPAQRRPARAALATPDTVHETGSA